MLQTVGIRKRKAVNEMLSEKLKKKNAPGYDRITTEAIKAGGEKWWIFPKKYSKS